MLETLPNVKVLVGDGLPGKVCKTYKEFILPSLLDTINASYELSLLSASMYQVMLVAILKPDKKVTHPDLYPPDLVAYSRC